MTQASPVRRPARRSSHSRTGPPNLGGRYGLLLLVLISTYLLSAFNGRKLTADLQIALFTAVVLLALRSSLLPGRWTALVGAGTLLGSATVLAVSLTGTAAGIGAADLWKALMLLGTAGLIVRHVLARPTVTLQSIYGALSAYLIIGLMFAAGYAAIGHLSRAPFFAGGQPVKPQTLQYFSFTTLTTLGYGDFTAAGDGGRAIAVMEALTGQVFLATLVARLVAAFRGPAEQEKPVINQRWPPRSVRDGGVRPRGKQPGKVRRPSSPSRKPP